MSTFVGYGFQRQGQFRKRDKGQLSGKGLDGLQRRIRQTLERGAAQACCSRTANTCANILKLWSAL